MTKRLSAERASEIIGGIYDCVLAPAHWDMVLSQICEELELANAALGVIRLPDGAQIHQSQVRIADDWKAIVPEYSEDLVALWGGAKRIQEYPLDEPIIQSQAIGRRAMLANRYFREQAKPRGMIDAVAFAIVRSPDALGNVVFGRHGASGKIDKEVIDGLRLLAPHFRRAVTISNLFDMKAIEAMAFRSTLDAVSFGVVIVDEGLRPLHANATAEAMLKAATPLRLERGVLALEPSSSQNILQDAVLRAAQDEATIGRKGIDVPVTGEGGLVFLLHALPLKQGAARHALVRHAAAAVFVAPAAAPLRMPVDGLALLYDLTPAEANIVEFLCQGLLPAEIATKLGTARSTVRTHLTHIFEKTDCRRQVDVIRLAASFSSLGLR